MTDKTLQLNCPTCHKLLVWSDANTYRPFCSSRCKLIDLGAWANEEHRIAGDELTNGLASDTNSNPDEH
jgi:endogenous inhibitor of DNA gyrase (YacG/DUF329 family)